MGALLRFLSLSASVSFTVGPRRVRIGRTVSPPPIPFCLLLPLLLVAGGLVGELQPLRADTIFLNSYKDTTDFDSDRVDTNAGVTVATTQRDRAKFTYTYGLGATNEFRNNSDLQYTWNLGPTPNDYDRAFYSTHHTNLYIHPWGSDSVANGNATNSEHTVENIYWSGSVITWQDTNVVQVGTNVSYSPFNPPWPGSAYTYTELISNGTNTTTVSVLSDVVLITDAPTGGTGSALYQLTSGFAIPGYTNGSALVNCAGQYTFAGLDADTNGVVWKVLTDGSANAVNAVIKTDYTNSITNFTFEPAATRVTLGIQWKSSNTNDTNWQSGPVYALKGTTVLFRVTTEPAPITFPTGLPTWSNGSNGVTQISLTFDTVSADTNGQWVMVTAGSAASNRVVVFDYEVKFQPDELGKFYGRSEYPTNFGVGEGVNFVTVSDPTGITPAISWSASGMSTAGAQDDWSTYATNSTKFQAGAFPETITVSGTLVSGPSTGQARSNQFAILEPTNAILKDVLLIETNNIWLSFPEYTSWRLFTNLNIGHTTNSETCWKKASYFLLPQDVSFHGIKTREGNGASPYQYSGGFFGNLAGFTAFLSTNGFTNTFGFVGGPPPIIFSYWKRDPHEAGPENTTSHPMYYAWGPIEPNYLLGDRFGIGEDVYGNQPYPAPGTNAPVLLTTRTGTFPMEFKFNTTNYHLITSITSTVAFYSDCHLEINKQGSGVHSKAYADPTSPE